MSHAGSPLACLGNWLGLGLLCLHAKRVVVSDRVSLLCSHHPLAVMDDVETLQQITERLKASNSARGASPCLALTPYYRFGQEDSKPSTSEPSTSEFASVFTTVGHFKEMLEEKMKKEIQMVVSSTNVRKSPSALLQTAFPTSFRFLESASSGDKDFKYTMLLNLLEHRLQTIERPQESSSQIGFVAHGLDVLEPLRNASPELRMKVTALRQWQDHIHDFYEGLVFAMDRSLPSNITNEDVGTSLLAGVELFSANKVFNGSMMNLFTTALALHALEKARTEGGFTFDGKGASLMAFIR